MIGFIKTGFRGLTIYLGWRYFLECRRYQTISARGLGATQGPQWVQAKALVGGPGGQSHPEAPGL